MSIAQEKNYRENQIVFPKRFELEGLDPREVQVKIVVLAGNQYIQKIYKNLDDVPADTGLRNLYGPFADKIYKSEHDWKWCLRFENNTAYNSFSK